MPNIQALNTLVAGTRIADAFAASPAVAPDIPAVQPSVPPPPPPPPPTPTTAASDSPQLSAVALSSRLLNANMLRMPTAAPVTHTLVTALARGAIVQLNGLDAATLREALNAIANRGLTPGVLMDYLERKVRVGEVLSNHAAQWTDTTKGDFAGQSGAFQMELDRTDAMDAIVSLAILNDVNLEAEIRAENTTPTTSTDLLQNRRVVWQSPAAGTVLTPPYVVLIAVEYQEVATADSVVSSIFDQLGTYQGFRFPKVAMQKL